MKRTLLLTIFGLLFATLYAQPQFFTSADMPNIGDHDTVRYLQYYPIPDSLDIETGNGHTWDFSYLPFSTYPNFYVVDSFRVKTHLVSQQFPDATIEEFVYDFTAGDVNLFSYGNDTLFIYRLGSVLNGVSLPIPLASIAFPLEINNPCVINDYFYVNAAAAGERRTTTVYDGNGTLHMPDGKTYTDVMRIKKIEKDTNYVSHGTLTATNYIWYKQGGQIPLLRMAYAGVSNLYFVFGSKSNNISTSVQEMNVQADFDIFPNPTDGKFQIAGLNFVPEKLEVLNLVGETIHQQKGAKEVDLSNFPKGIYFVKISHGQKMLTKKIVVQ
jgi:hypothetical protein